MLYLIQIHWQHRQDETQLGTTTYAQPAASLRSAQRKAAAKYRRHYGKYRAITAINEQPDPAGIYQS